MSGTACCCGGDGNSSTRGRNDSRVSPEQLISNGSGNVRIKPQRITLFFSIPLPRPQKTNLKYFLQSTSSRDSDETLPINRTCSDVTFLILGIAFIIVLVSIKIFAFKINLWNFRAFEKI